MASSKTKKTGIKRVIVEKLLKEKQLEIRKKVDFVQKVKQSLQIESKKISELEGAILALNEILTGEKVE